MVAIDQQARFRRAYRTIDLLSRPFARYCAMDLPTETALAFEGPCIVASNHRSLFDALAAIQVLGSFGQTGRVVSAAWLWQNRILGRLLDHIGAIPLHSGRAGLESVDVAVAALAAGDNLVITPEGRVVPPAERTDGVGVGHKFLSRVAHRAGVPVVPAALVGTDDLWPLDRRFPRLRPWRRQLILAAFAPPLHFATAAHRRNVDDTLMQISALIRELESGPVAGGER